MEIILLFAAIGLGIFLISARGSAIQKFLESFGEKNEDEK